MNEKYVTYISIGGVARDVKDKRFEPSSATSEMTQEVGLSSNGKLFTKAMSAEAATLNEVKQYIGIS